MEALAAAEARGAALWAPGNSQTHSPTATIPAPRMKNRRRQ
jgi:hypothetical protein